MSCNCLPLPRNRHLFTEAPEQPRHAEKPPHWPWRHPKHPKPLPDDRGEEPPAGNGRADRPAVVLPAPHTASRRTGILVVDDDGPVRALLQVVLDQQGFAVWAAATGLEALELYQAWGSAIDVVLLDVRMPGLDGPQTLVGLRRLNPALCCCFMTGGTGGYTLEELIARGAAHVFEKPFRPFEVAQTLRALVHQPEAEAQPVMAHDRCTEGLPELFRG